MPVKPKPDLALGFDLENANSSNKNSNQPLRTVSVLSS